MLKEFESVFQATATFFSVFSVSSSNNLYCPQNDNLEPIEFQSSYLLFPLHLGDGLSASHGHRNVRPLHLSENGIRGDRLDHFPLPLLAHALDPARGQHDRLRRVHVSLRGKEEEIR
jgi:hypothetical protein